MPRVLTLALLVLLLGGCANTFSRCVVVRSPVTEDEDEGARPAPADVVSAKDPAFAAPGPKRGSWRTYDPGFELTEAERIAYRKRCCLVRARKKSNLLAVGFMAGMTAYGFAYFGFGSQDFEWKDDGWFGQNSNSGGADKLGHAVTTHILTCSMAAINRGWGIPRKEAAIRGAAAAWATMFVMEIGDGFSQDFGFSWPDIVANTVGAAFGYFHSTDRRFQEILDFRWEYWPSDYSRETGEGEFTTDYEGSAYVLAANIGAIACRHRHVLDFFDVQLGWQTRGYVDPSVPMQRTAFVGLGINLQTVCNRLGLRHLGKVFQFYQPPGIHLRWNHDL